MKNNVGSCDRVIRIVLAAVIGYLVYAKVVTGTLAIVLGIVAAVLALTGLIGWCGLYTILGKNTGSCCGGGSAEGEKKGCCCGDDHKG